MIENKGINTVMNSFNRLLYTYRFIFNRKYYLIIIEKCAKFCIFRKNAYICNTEKTIKLTIMEEMKKNYRITIIFKDQIMVEKFYEERIAKDTIRSMKELFPSLFIGAALEEKCKNWKVIWTLGNN